MERYRSAGSEIVNKLVMFGDVRRVHDENHALQEGEFAISIETAGIAAAPQSKALSHKSLDVVFWNLPEGAPRAAPRYRESNAGVLPVLCAIDTCGTVARQYIIGLKSTVLGLKFG